MGRLAFAVLLLSLGLSGRVSSSNLGKASLMSGSVNPDLPGQGVTNTPTCLTGNPTQSSCGEGVPAGITYATTAQFWSESHTNMLTAGAASSLTLASGHVGVVVTSGSTLCSSYTMTCYLYQVYISDGASSEAVWVTGGTYTSASGGTILFTPYFNHGPSAYTVESASSGIQEAWNSVCGTSAIYYENIQCNVTVPANGATVGGVHSINTYNVYGTIFLHGSQSVLSGYGVSLSCLGRGPCIQVGDRISSNHAVHNTLQGFAFRSPTNNSSNPAYAGSLITSTTARSGTATITTGAAHGFRPGDLVTQLYTDNSAYWGDATIATVPLSTSYTINHSGTAALQTTPGVVALDYSAVLDNGMGTRLLALSYDLTSEYGHFNLFFDMWDDENATIEHFNNNGIALNYNGNWTSSFIFSGGNDNSVAPGQLAPVISLRDSNFTANYGNCVTVYNSNGLYIDNIVCQASGLWQVYSSNTTGNYQGAFIQNIYSESSIALNPFGILTGSVTSGSFQQYEQVKQTATNANMYLMKAPTGSQAMLVSAFVGTPDATDTWVGQTSSAVYTPSGRYAFPYYITPFPGTGIAGLIAGQSAGSFQVKGSGNPFGGFQTGGTGSTKYSYFIVANDTTTSTRTSPMRVLDWSSTGSDQIPVFWPRIASGTDTITYDVIRMTTPGPISAPTPFPNYNSCPGGSGGTCGYVALGLSQAAACNGGLVCRYVDSGSSTTTAYQVNSGNYTSQLNFWPGALVEIGNTGAPGVQVDNEISPVVGIGLNTNPAQTAQRCTGYGVASSGGYTACLTSVTSPGGGVPNQTATLLSDGGNTMTQSKGRLNFSQLSTVQAHHIITLLDSQPYLTRATPGYRPLASANDVWIGTDVPAGGAGLSSGQLAFGAPVSITNYIRATGDGVHTNWLERLTSKQKTFAVPVRISEGNSFTLGDGSPLSQMKIYSIKNLPASHVPPQSCVDVDGEAKGLTKSDQITGVTPPARLGDLSLNAYAAGADAIVLHFCNPSGTEAITPPGTYSFLAVH